MLRQGRPRQRKGARHLPLLTLLLLGAVLLCSFLVSVRADDPPAPPKEQEQQQQQQQQPAPTQEPAPAQAPEPAPAQPEAPVVVPADGAAAPPPAAVPPAAGVAPLPAAAPAVPAPADTPLGPRLPVENNDPVVQKAATMAMTDVTPVSGQAIGWRVVHASKQEIAAGTNYYLQMELRTKTRCEVHETTVLVEAKSENMKVEGLCDLLPCDNTLPPADYMTKNNKTKQQQQVLRAEEGGW